MTRSNPSEIAKAGDLPGFPSLTDQQPQRFVAQALYVMAGLTAVGFILVLTFRGFRRRLLIEPVLVVMCFAAPVLFGLLSIRLGHPDPPGGVGVLALVTYLAPIGFHLLMAGGPDAFISTVGGLDVPPILLAIGWPFVVVGFPIFVLVFFATVET